MAVGMNISNANLLMRKYEKAIVECVNLEADLFGQIPSEMWEGERIEYRLETAKMSSLGNTSEGAAFPAANLPILVTAFVGRKFLHAAAQLTDGVMAAARGGAHSFRSSTESVIKGLAESVAAYKEGMLFLDGTGRVATLGAGAAAAQTSNVLLTGMDSTRADDTHPVKMVWPKGVYEVRDEDNSYALLGYVTISNIDPLSAAASTASVDLEAPGLPTGVAAGDVLVWKDCHSIAYEGLSNLVDNDVSGTFQGVDFTTDLSASSYTSMVLSNSNTLRAMTPSLFRQFLQGMREKAGKKALQGLRFICHSAQLSKFADMFEGSIVTNNGNEAVGNGSVVLNTPFGQVKLEANDFCPPSTIFALNVNELRFVQQKALGWRPGINGPFNPSQTSAVQTAQMYEIGQVMVRDRRRLGKILDLDYSLASGF